MGSKLRFQLALVCATSLTLVGQAATLLVWRDSPSPTPPYGSWRTAAHVLQEAVDAAILGDIVLVTNGVYLTGGRALVGTMTNRVAVDRAINLRSVNGADVTVIQGGKDTRCAYLEPVPKARVWAMA